VPEIVAKLTDYTLYLNHVEEKGDPNYIITYYLQQNTFTGSRTDQWENERKREY
jgi:hypothetical protein